MIVSLSPGSSCLVGCPSGGSQRRSDEVLQTGVQIVFRIPGVVVGLLSACGARAKKRVNWLLESASATSFSFPGRCLQVAVKLCCAAVRKSILSSDTISDCFDDLSCQASTIA